MELAVAGSLVEVACRVLEEVVLGWRLPEDAAAADADEDADAADAADRAETDDKEARTDDEACAATDEDDKTAATDAAEADEALAALCELRIEAAETDAAEATLDAEASRLEEIDASTEDADARSIVLEDVDVGAEVEVEGLNLGGSQPLVVEVSRLRARGGRATDRLVLIAGPAGGRGATKGKPHPPLLGTASGKLKPPPCCGASTTCATQLQMYASEGPPRAPPGCTLPSHR